MRPLTLGLCTFFVGLVIGCNSEDSSQNIFFPQELTFSAFETSANSVELIWPENSKAMSVLERSHFAFNGGYTTIFAGAPGVHRFRDSGLRPATQYWYRLSTVTSGSTPTISNIITIITLKASYTASAYVGGKGRGTLSSPGLSCSTACANEVETGTTILFVATPEIGSSFDGWQGCDQVINNQCAIKMNRDRSAVAVFSFLSDSPSDSPVELVLPESSTSGNYNLQWSSPNSSPQWLIEETSGPGFFQPNVLVVTAMQYPFTHSSGHYCYRVGSTLSSSLSAPKCITVAQPSEAILRIENQSHYDVVELSINGDSHLLYPHRLTVDGAHNFVLPAAGLVRYSAGLGFYGANSQPIVFHRVEGSLNVTAGTVTPLVLENPTPSSVLADHSFTRRWTGNYFCYRCTQSENTKTYEFKSDGTFRLLDSTLPEVSGQVDFISWADYGLDIRFRLCLTCGITSLPFPFTSFELRNGPPDWPTIVYKKETP